MHWCVHCRCCRVKIKVRNFKTAWCSAIFNKQECIAIMLLRLNHSHSEHKPKADVYGYSYRSMATFMTTYGTLSRCSDHSFATHYYNKYPCMVLLLNGVASHDLSSLFSAGGPLAAKRTIHGNHSWSGGTIYSNTICHWWSRGPVVAGDHLRRASSHKHITCVFEWLLY